MNCSASRTLHSSIPRAQQLYGRVLSPKPTLLKQRIAQLKGLLQDHEKNNQFKMVRMRAQLSQLSNEKIRVNRQQLINLESMDEMANEVAILSRRLEQVEQKATHWKNNNRKLQTDIDRMIEVNRGLESRTAINRDRLLKIIGRFKREYMPSIVDPDEIATVEGYIQYVEDLLKQQTQKTEAESTRCARITKQYDSLFGRFKAIQQANRQLSQQVEILNKQREIEQIDQNRINENLNSALVLEQTKLQRSYQNELNKALNKAQQRKQKNKTLKSEVYQLKRQLVCHLKLQEELRGKLEESQSKIHLLKEEIQQLNDMLNLTNKQIQLVEAQTTQLKQQLVEAERSLKKNSIEVSEYRKSLVTKVDNTQSQHQRQCRILKHRIEEFERKLNLTLDQLDQAYKHLVATQEENNQLHRQNKKLKEYLEHYRKNPLQLAKTPLNMSDGRRSQKMFRRHQLLSPDREHKLKLIGQLQSMVQNHRQIYLSENPHNKKQ